MKLNCFHQSACLIVTHRVCNIGRNSPSNLLRCEPSVLRDRAPGISDSESAGVSAGITHRFLGECSTSSEETMHITSQQRQFFADNGYLAVESVIPLDIVAAEKARFDWLCKNWDSPEAQQVNVAHETGLPREKWSAKTVRKAHRLVPHEPLFRAHALHPNLLDIVADLIGTPFSLYDDQALLKPPSVGSPKPPHQDNAYFKVKPADAVITCWCAIDEATLENG